MQVVVDSLTNRDIALAVWLLIALAAMLFTKSIRVTLGPLLKHALVWQISVRVLLMVAYIVLVIMVERRFKLWDLSLLKDTVIWFCGTALVLFGRSVNAGDKPRFFRNVVIDNLKLTVIIEFIVSTYVFPLWVELLLVPLIFLLAALAAVAGIQKEKKYEPTRKLLNRALAVVGIYITLHAIFGAVADFKNFANVVNLKDLVLAPILSIALLPFIYALALQSVYEQIFLRIDHFGQNKDKGFSRFAKRQVLLACNVRLGKAGRFLKRSAARLAFIESNTEMLAHMRAFKVNEEETA